MKLDFTKSNYALRRELHHMQPYDIAEIITELELEEQQRVMHLIGVKKTAQVFSRLTIYMQLELFETFSEQRKSQVLENLEIDELKEFIFANEEEEREKLLGYLKPTKANVVKDLLVYSIDLAPSIMSTEFLTIGINMTVQEATSFLFHNVKDNDFIENLYVVDEYGVLIGVLRMKDLIIARKGDSIKNLIEQDFHYAYRDNTVKEAIDIVKKYDVNALPVLDRTGRLLGLITADDALEQLVHEYDQLYNRLAFINSHDETYSGVQRSLRRLPWLIVATVLNLVIVAVLQIFEATVAEIIVILLFQPMILDMAGNIGTQSLAVTLLHIHKDNLEDRKAEGRHFLKELGVALFNSLTVAVIGFLISFGYLSISKTPMGNANLKPYMMGIVVFIALFLAMFLSALLGTLLPMILNKTKANPDNAAGPILTTLNDVIALFVYFGAATVLIAIIV